MTSFSRIVGLIVYHSHVATSLPLGDDVASPLPSQIIFSISLVSYITQNTWNKGHIAEGDPCRSRSPAKVFVPIGIELVILLEGWIECQVFARTSHCVLWGEMLTGIMRRCREVEDTGLISHVAFLYNGVHHRGPLLALQSSRSQSLLEIRRYLRFTDDLALCSRQDAKNVPLSTMSYLRGNPAH